MDVLESSGEASLNHIRFQSSPVQKTTLLNFRLASVFMRYNFMKKKKKRLEVRSALNARERPMPSPFRLHFPFISNSQNTFPPNSPQIQGSIDVLTRISLHKNQVSKQALSDSSSIGKAKTSGSEACGGSKSLEGCKSTFVYKKEEFVMQGKAPCSS
jgi:hypothetical protein